MCLGTFSRLARSLATIYIFARVRIFGTLVPFYGTGNTMDIADHASQALPIWNAKHRHSFCEMRVISRMTEYYINHIETGE